MGMMRDDCFELAVEELTGRECPRLDGEGWADTLQSHLASLELRAMFFEVNKRVIVSRRLENGKLHAEVMHPTLITILEKR
jgi:hypothetical protein